MVEIISVRFKSGGKPYYFNPEGHPFEVDDGVIVETSRGVEYAVCVQGNTMIDEMELIAPLRPVIRKATPEDLETLKANREKEREAFEICRARIQEHNLDMKLVSAEYSFEGSKILFLFTSDGRVDFRSLVKDLAGALHTRIELRQIGVRDEARLKGGLGICGRPFCCAQFLDDFQPVSIKMAKTQSLSLNPTKISGTCGRLMCCLKYEQDAYEDLMKSAPKLESFVETPDGAGTVAGINLLRQTAQVRLESAPENCKCYHNSELCIVRSGKGKRPEGYVEPPLEELARLRRQPEEPPPEEPEESWPGAEDSVPEPDPESAAGEETEGQRAGRRRRRNRRPGATKQAKPADESAGNGQEAKSGSAGKAQSQKGEGQSKGRPQKDGSQGKGQAQKSEGKGKGARAKGEAPGKGQPQKGEARSKGKGQQSPKGQVPRVKPLTPKGETPKKEAAKDGGGRAEGAQEAQEAKEKTSRRPRRRRSRGGGEKSGAEAPPAAPPAG